jgi:hypothetical protein
MTRSKLRGIRPEENDGTHDCGERQGRGSPRWYPAPREQLPGNDFLNLQNVRPAIGLLRAIHVQHLHASEKSWLRGNERSRSSEAIRVADPSRRLSRRLEISASHACSISSSASKLSRSACANRARSTADNSKARCKRRSLATMGRNLHPTPPFRQMRHIPRQGPLPPLRRIGLHRPKRRIHRGHRPRSPGGRGGCGLRLPKPRARSPTLGGDGNRQSQGPGPPPLGETPEFGYRCQSWILFPVPRTAITTPKTAPWHTGSIFYCLRRVASLGATLTRPERTKRHHEQCPDIRTIVVTPGRGGGPSGKRRSAVGRSSRALRRRREVGRALPAPIWNAPSSRSNAWLNATDCPRSRKSPLPACLGEPSDPRRCPLNQVNEFLQESKTRVESGFGQGPARGFAHARHPCTKPCATA